MNIKTEILENGNLRLTIDESDENEEDQLSFKDYDEQKSDVMEAIHDEYRWISDEEKMLLGDLTDADILTTLDDFDFAGFESRVIIQAVAGEIPMPKKLGESIKKFLDQDWNDESWVDVDNVIKDWIGKLVSNGEVVLKARKNA